MNVRTYNPSVRVGNWNEDIQLEEDTLKDFLNKRENGQLLCQKRAKLEQAIEKKVDLTVARDDRCVYYGDRVNVWCPHKDCLLVVLPDIEKVLYKQEFESPCKVSGSITKKANLRSTFVIKSIGEGNEGMPLRYEDEFHISTLDKEGGSLLLHSDMVSLHKCSTRSRHQEVKLVDEASPFTKWKVQHFNPKLRMEYQGSPVPANERVIITHIKTNQDLAVEENFRTKTPFGSNEFEITGHTYLDSHRAEKEVNHWVLKMGAPGEDICPDTSGFSSQATNL